MVTDITTERKAHEALRESEARKAAILEAALDCVLIIDDAGTITEFNPAAETAFGYSREEAIGKPMADLIVPPASLEGRWRGVERRWGAGQGQILDQRLELSAIRSDGGEFPVELAITKVDLPGQTAFTAYVRDITEQIRAREREQRQESRLAGALVGMQRERDRLELFYNLGARLSLGAEVEVLGDVILDVFAEEVPVDIGVLYAVDEEDSTVFSFTAGHGIDDTYGMPGTLDLSEPWAAADRIAYEAHGTAAVPLLEGASVQVCHVARIPLRYGSRRLGLIVLGRHSDAPFTDAEQELLEHLVLQATTGLSNAISLRDARRLANINTAILDSTVDGITMFDPSGKILFENAAMRELGERFFGGGVAQGKTAAERQAGVASQLTDPALYLSDMAELAASPEQEALSEYELAGSGAVIERYTAPVRDPRGDILGRILVIRDVTAQREVDRLKSELVATVSHELRTPLTGIAGFAELLLEQEPDDEDRRRFVETIASESRRLMALVDDFLDLQRIETGVLSLNRERFMFCDLARETVQAFSGQAARHSIDVRVPAEDVEVYADRRRIAQVLQNLVSNAIKYSPDGGEIVVDTSAEGDKVRVSVADGGIGIPADQHEQIFGRFFRVDSSDTRRIGGAGLGLAVCKEIVGAHGGSIDFQSVEGQGSTFWFELPASAPSEPSS